MNIRNSARRVRPGFTFLELIVSMSIIMVLVALLFPVFARARESARRTSCESNLRQIGTALHLYAQDNNGCFPQDSGDWGQVLMPQVKNTQVFRCPDETWRKPGGYPSSGTIPPGWSSYQYRGGLANDDESGLAIARDWDPWHEDGINTLFLDVHVKWEPADSVSLERGTRPGE